MGGDDYRDYEDDGRVVGITSAMPGWWAVYHDEHGDFRAPVAAWVLTEHTSQRYKSHMMFRSPSVFAVVPTGDSMGVDVVTTDDYDHIVYDPDYRATEPSRSVVSQ